MDRRVLVFPGGAVSLLTTAAAAAGLSPALCADALQLPVASPPLSSSAISALPPPSSFSPLPPAFLSAFSPPEDAAAHAPPPPSSSSPPLAFGAPAPPPVFGVPALPPAFGAPVPLSSFSLPPPMKERLAGWRGRRVSVGWGCVCPPPGSLAPREKEGRKEEVHEGMKSFNLQEELQQQRRNSCRPLRWQTRLFGNSNLGGFLLQNYQREIFWPFWEV